MDGPGRLPTGRPKKRFCISTPHRAWGGGPPLDKHYAPYRNVDRPRNVGLPSRNQQIFPVGPRLEISDPSRYRSCDNHSDCGCRLDLYKLARANGLSNCHNFWNGLDGSQAQRDDSSLAFAAYYRSRCWFTDEIRRQRTGSGCTCPAGDSWAFGTR